MKKSKPVSERNTPSKIKDRHLDIPSEANRDKHVNFVAQERGDGDPSLEPPGNNLVKSRKDKQKNK